MLSEHQKGFTMAFQRTKYLNPEIQIGAMHSRYPHFKAKKLGEGKIEFTGDLRVKPELPVYTVSIIYRGDLSPIAKILNPDLVAEPPHIYKESRTLCLYHPV